MGKRNSGLDGEFNPFQKKRDPAGLPNREEEKKKNLDEI